MVRLPCASRVLAQTPSLSHCTFPADDGIRFAALYFCATGSIFVGSIMPCAARAALAWYCGLARRKAETFGATPAPGPAWEKLPANISGVKVLTDLVTPCVNFCPS